MACYGIMTTCPQPGWLLQGVHVDHAPPALRPLAYDSSPTQSSVRGTTRLPTAGRTHNEDGPGYVGSGSSARALRTLPSGLSAELGAARGRRAHLPCIPGVTARHR